MCFSYHVFQVEYFKVGSDYSQFEGKAPSGQGNRYGVAQGTPVNKILIEKLQAPKIASSMRQMFETGDFVDLHSIRKLEITRDDAPEAGVYENEPTTMEGVVRESDEVTEGEVLEEGMTKNIVTAWKQFSVDKGTEAKLSTITIDTSMSGPAELENQPIRLDGVTREADPLNEVIVPEEGFTNKLRYKFLYPEETKVPRGPIKLVEREDEPVVYENEPCEQDPGVVRSDYEQEQMEYDSGYIRNVAGFFATVSDDTRKSKAPIVIDRSNVTILESQPIFLDNVVRESDMADVDAQLSLEAGRTRNLASRWQNVEDSGPKERRQPINMDLAPEAGVLENEPVVLDNVIRCDAPMEDVMLPGAPGRIKTIAGRFISPTGGNEGKRKDMIQIEMAAESGVVENTPSELSADIVRCDAHTEDQNEVHIDQGTAGSLKQRWREHEEDHMKIRSCQDFQEGPKSRWVNEIDNKDSNYGGIFENDPNELQGVVREGDINPDENQGEFIESNFSKSMKSMWLTREAEEDRRIADTRRFIPEVKKGDGRLKQAIREAEQDMQRQETPKERFERERRERKDKVEREMREKEGQELLRKQEEAEREKEKEKENRRTGVRKKKVTQAPTATGKPKVSLFR